MSNKKKILIIYEKMGMGHQRMANILTDMLGGGEEVEIISRAGSDIQGSSDVYTIVNMWNYLIKKNLIRTCDVLLNFIIRIVGLPILEVTETPSLMDKLDEIKPDIIISTADGFNKSLGAYCSERKIPFYIFITEISTFIDLVNPYATHICYFNETPEAIRSYDFNLTYFSKRIDRNTTLGQKIKYVLKSYYEHVIKAYKNSIFKNPNKHLEQLNNAKCEVIGPLAEKKHFTSKNVDDIKGKYKIPMGRDTVLIVSGSIGGGFLTEMVETICKHYESPLNLLVMCGRDNETYQKILGVKNNNNMINIMPYGYTNNFDEFLAASDCIIARPSAGIFIESLLNKTPMITFDTVTSNDKGTLTMIEKYNIGRVCSDEDELLPALDELLVKKDEIKGNIEKLLRGYYQTYEDKKLALRSIILENQRKPVIQHETQYDVSEEELQVSTTYNNLSR